MDVGLGLKGSSSPRRTTLCAFIIQQALAVGGLGSLAACATNSAHGLDQSSTRTVPIASLYRTQDPKVLVAQVDESTLDRSSYCWVEYRFSVTVEDKKVYIGQTARSASTPHGYSCTLNAVAAYQEVRLPVAYRGKKLFDASTHQRIRLSDEPQNMPSPISAPTISPGTG